MPGWAEDGFRTFKLARLGKRTLNLTPATCPNCGAMVPEGARSCAECGSDEQTGWSDTAREQAFDPPVESDDDDEEAVEREFDGTRPRRQMQWLWWVVAVAALAGLLVLILH